MMKKIKNFICLALSTVTIMGLSVSTFANNANTTPDSVEVITDTCEINQLLREKGIFEESEDVLAVIEIDYDAPAIRPQPHWIIREIYAEYIRSSTETKSSPKYTNDYPAGSFTFTQSITSGWQLIDDLGLKVEMFEAALNYQLNESTTESWTYISERYTYPITVKAYVNWERELYNIYDADPLFDDYIGETAVERETGYTIKVTKQ